MPADVLDPDVADSNSAPNRRRTSPLVWISVILVVAGAAWSLAALRHNRVAVTVGPLQRVERLTPGIAASMDSPALSYGDGWRVSDVGADPSEPSDPWQQPSGVFTFPFTGSEAALNLALGDYWAYVYVTVDGEPASLLPNIRGNVDSQGRPAGYRTFFAPDLQAGGEPQTQWVPIHRGGDASASHEARVEVWRGWGQSPIRGVAIDALPPSSTPLWPGLAMCFIGIALFTYSATRAGIGKGQMGAAARLREGLAWLLLPALNSRLRLVVAAAFAFGIALGVGASSWPLAAGGLVGLALVSVGRPALWTAILVFALPFYYSYTMPILPGRDIGLIDALVLLGLAIALAHGFLAGTGSSRPGIRKQGAERHLSVMALLLALLIGWALVSVSAARRTDVALYEWRTVFLSAGLFAVLLWTSLRSPRAQRSDLWVIVSAWVAGGMVVALAGLIQYATGTMLIAAEGVYRIRAFYGSPNNLALYLERTFLVTLALGAFLPAGRARIIFAVAAAVQALALVLTFSKGALLLGVPAGLAALWVGGLVLLARQERSRRPLLWLGAAAVVILLALSPFLGTERFRGLLDFSQGTGFLRLQLWRSSWQMALDHPLLGVGPDNFLYAYRSEYLLPEAWQEPNLNHPHNWILDWWTRIGIPGLAIAAALFAVGLVQRWRTVTAAATSRPAEAALSLGFLAAAVGALTHGLIDASFALPDLMVSWVLILMAAITLDDGGR